MEDLSMNLDSLDSYLSSHCDSVAAVFITSLVGLTPDMGKIQRIADKYGVRVMMDNCENLFGKYNGSNVSSFFPSTTSTYFGHQLQSVEGGFVFTNDDDMNDSILMLRNHGMIRSLGRDGYKYANQLVDQQFDFFSLGNNFRNSEIHALVGLLDLNRASQYIDTRNKLANEFFTRLDSVKFFVPENNYDGGCEHVMFCLPIIFTNSNIDSIGLSKSYCQLNGIETRPIISGNLLRQTCFKQYDDYTKFPVSEYVHTHGFYVGLHPKVNINELQRLAQVLNFFSVL
jgi:CDP-6-deoxy-D-xylo-4-hexulose-3-dehydrase